MQLALRVRVALTMFTGMLVAAAVAPGAWAQMPGGPGSPSPALPGPGPVPNPADSGGAGWLAAVILVVGLAVIIGAAAKVVDLSSKRESEALELQAQVGDAFLRDGALSRLPVVPTAHVPILKGSPATVEISGQVPNAELRQVAVRIAEQEASRVRPDVHIEDRLGVVPAAANRAA